MKLMAKPSDHPGFNALQKEWYSKLKNAGFKDIENSDLGASNGSVSVFRRKSLISIEAQAQFFRRVAKHVAETHFESEMERRILTLYSEGQTQSEIQDRLEIKGHRCKVYGPIYKWLEEWGLK